VYLMYPARSRPTHSGTLPLAGGTPPLTPPGLLSVPWLVCRGGASLGVLAVFLGSKRPKISPGIGPSYHPPCSTHPPIS
jgi:hypothetical protein